MPGEPPKSARVRFADFTFDPVTGELEQAGAKVPLEHQPSLVLRELIEGGGALVTRAELAARLWHDGRHVAVDDGLNYCIRQLRAALGDAARAPRFIETLPRRGYRFIAPVERPTDTGRREQRHEAASTVSRLVNAAAVALLVAATAVAESRPNDHHAVAVKALVIVHDWFFR